MKSAYSNFETQYYKTIPLMLIDRKYGNRKALRFTINGTNQNVWIPLKYLDNTGTILPNQDLDWIFRKAKNQLIIAGVHQAIQGIKSKTNNQ